MRLRRLWVALALTAAALQPVPGGAATLDPDDALLFEMRVGTHRVGDAVRGYRTGEGACLNLPDVIAALDVALRIDGARIAGWAFDEGRAIAIDRDAGTERVGQQQRKVAPHDILDTPDGWCVALSALGRWTGATYTPDYGNAIVTVAGDRKLPPELAAERRARVPVRAISFDLASLPGATLPWRGVKAPAIDVTMTLGARADRVAGDARTATMEAFAAGEIGPVAWDARAAVSAGGAPAVRMRAYRVDPARALPLRATQIAAGDVAGFATPLGTGAVLGRGAMITNRPVDRRDTFDRTDFRGDLPIGWDAELYRDGELLAFARSRPDGRYEFLDVPLRYGPNRFEVVLYGPQGQVRREIHAAPVGADSIPPRETWWWASAQDAGRDLFRPPGAAPVFGGGPRATLAAERGLDLRTSIAAALHTLRTPLGARATIAEAALRRSFGATLAEFGLAQRLSGGTAARAQFLGAAGPVRFAAETLFATRGYESDRVLADVRGQHSASVDFDLNLARLRLPIHLGSRLTQRRSGLDVWEAGARTSMRLARIALTGGLRYRAQRTRIGPAPPVELEAELLASARVGRVMVRGETLVGLSGQRGLRALRLTGDWTGGRDPDRPALWSADLAYTQGVRRLTAGLSHARTFRAVAVTARVEGATDGSVAALLGLNFSLGRNPEGGGVRMRSDRLAAGGSVVARVFRDANANGRHDTGEAWEKDVAVTAGRTAVARTTGADGAVTVDGLQPHLPILIAVDAGSLPDPLVQPAGPGMVVTPRPGTIVAVALPLVSAGDVDGTLARPGGGTASGIDLELLDDSGRAIATTRTDFDGFFLFEGVPYGRYRMRIAPLAAAAHGLAPALASEIVIGAAAPSVHLGTVAARAP